MLCMPIAQAVPSAWRYGSPGRDDGTGADLSAAPAAEAEAAAAAAASEARPVQLSAGSDAGASCTAQRAGRCKKSGMCWAQGSAAKRNRPPAALGPRKMAPPP